MNIETMLAGAFRSHDYTWKLNGEDVKPSPEMIRQNLDGMKLAMYDDGPGTMMLLGRLILVKRAKDKFDIYLMVGEDNGTE